MARSTEMASDVVLPLATLKPGTALNAEELHQYGNAVSTAFSERNAITEKIKAGTATEWDYLQFSYLTDVATTLYSSYRGAIAEAGRGLNILKAKKRVIQLGALQGVQSVQRLGRQKLL